LIQTAQSYHLKDLVRLAQKYYAESPYVATHQFDEDKLLDTLRRGMIYPVVEIAVAERDNKTVGGAVTYLTEYSWCQGTRCSMEFFYVEPEYRGHGLAEGLLEHCMAWGRQMGALEFTAGDIGLRPRLTQRFFEQNGLSDDGVVLRKVFNEILA
jgi:GNAT superfamily N-acetyltransferase